MLLLLNATADPLVMQVAQAAVPREVLAQPAEALQAVPVRLAVVQVVQLAAVPVPALALAEAVPLPAAAQVPAAARTVTRSYFLSRSRAVESCTTNCGAKLL